MNDLISRKAMIEALGHFNDYKNGNEHFLYGIETAKEITENLPSIDPDEYSKRCRNLFKSLMIYLDKRYNDTCIYDDVYSRGQASAFYDVEIFIKKMAANEE